MLTWIRSQLGRLVGILELLGLRYPVHHYIEKVDFILYRGSRIDKVEDYNKLKEFDVATIVDLCAEGHLDKHAPDSFKIVRIPVIDNTAPFESQVEYFIDLCNKAPLGQAIFVHCEAGIGRTGTFVACYRISCCNWSVEYALAEALKFGKLVKPQIDFIRSWGNKHGRN